MKWGLIGCGDMATKTTVPSMAGVEGCELVAVCGRHEDRTRMFADRFKVPKTYVSVADLAADPEIEAVFISTPVTHHAWQALACLEREKHVLCEKPMSITTAQSREMCDLSERDGLVLGLAYYRRTYDLHRTVKRLIQDGALGSIRQYRFNFATWYRPEEGAPGSWRLDPKQGGGGVLPDVGSHRIDLARFYGGPFATVHGMATTTVPGWEVEDVASAVLGFRDGAHASVDVSFSQEMGQDRMEVHGSEGVIIASACDDGTFLLQRNGKLEMFEKPIPPPSERHAELIRNFQAAIRDEEPVVCSGAEGMETTLVIEKVLSSYLP